MKEHTDILKLLIKNGNNSEVDLATLDVVLDQYVGSQRSLKEGYFYFIDEPKLPAINLTGSFYLVSTAVCLLKIGDGYYGHIGVYNISTLISSYSKYLDARGNEDKASRLYGVPLVKDQEHWNGLKYNFVKNNIIGRELKVISSESANSVTWRFVNGSDDIAQLGKITQTNKFTEFTSTEAFKEIIRKNPTKLFNVETLFK